MSIPYTSAFYTMHYDIEDPFADFQVKMLLCLDNSLAKFNYLYLLLHEITQDADCGQEWVYIYTD